MKRALAPIPMIILLALAGCGKLADAVNETAAGSGEEGGRYSGVGIYQADSLWNEIEGAQATNDAQAARKDDDNQIIVLVDRRTGEVRQCGNHSGFCVAMNPWSGKDREKTPQLPAQLVKHASDLANEAEAAQRAEEEAAKAHSKANRVK